MCPMAQNGWGIVAQKVCISRKRQTNTELFQTIPPSRLSASHLPLHKGGFGAKLVSQDRTENRPLCLTNPYHYDVHRILTPDGYAFEISQIENAEPTTEEAQSRKETAVVTPISSASNEIVSHDNTDSQPPQSQKTGQGTVLCLLAYAFSKTEERPLSCAVMPL